ncbi:MAG: DNA mismatch repair endonuclease MutL [Christensenellales bacterium]
MSRINILDESVFNKIAAGEVVEKPASIVKELVENSLDAKATEILVEIEDGGINKIRVVDNGEGIHPDDVKPAFITHATSKIKSVDDLASIVTLGFRGEALSSIASVSKLKMQTKQESFQEGKQIEIEGGIVKDFCDYPMNTGTIVEVEDLFYNIPARKKFLRKPKTEESEITNLMSRYILANPNIKFSYVVDGNLIYKTNGSNLEDAIYQVYKKDTLSNLIKVDYSYDKIRIFGYISKPTYSKSNRTYQTLIINGRYVVNSMISTCVQNAYENLLMKGQFPFYVLNFVLPPDSVDVNVHPNKLDVKFDNFQKVYGYFYTAVSKALLNNSTIKQINVFDNFSAQNRHEKAFERENLVGKSFCESLNGKDNVLVGQNQKIERDKIFQNEQIGQESQENKIAQEKLKVYENFGKLSNSLGDEFCENEIMAKVLNRQLDRVEKENSINPKLKSFDENFDDKKDNVEEVNLQSNLQNAQNFAQNMQKNAENGNIFGNFATKQQIFENIDALNYKIVGCLFDTYILIEINNSIFVFDQHACHERLNYDKLVNSLENKDRSVQPLLVPYIFETNELETTFLEEKQDLITGLGFEISLFGQNCFKVSTVPSVLSDVNLKDFFDDILSDLSGLKKISTQNMLKEKLAQKACKASVKAGNKLGKTEIDMLLGLMQKNNMTLSCPHGRPAVVEITKNELEKWFKRKV